MSPALSDSVLYVGDSAALAAYLGSSLVWQPPQKQFDPNSAPGESASAGPFVSQTITITTRVRVLDKRWSCSSGAVITNTDNTSYNVATKANVVSVSTQSGGMTTGACGCGVSCIINNPPNSTATVTYSDGTSETFQLAGTNLTGVSSTQYGERGWGSWVERIEGSLSGLLWIWQWGH